MASSVRRPGRLLLVLAVACLCQQLLSECFVPAAHALSAQKSQAPFNAVAVASAVLPVVMLAEDAEAKYGDFRKWSAILVPLTTLVLPAFVFGGFVLYSFDDNAFYQFIPGSKKSLEKSAAWREHPVFANIKDPMDGLLDKDDYEKGLEEAWEKAKPAGCTITVKDKLKELSEQNAPHFYMNKVAKSA